MKQPNFPQGWDEERVRRVLEHYEQQSEEEAVAEDEAAYESTAFRLPRSPSASARTSRKAARWVGPCKWRTFRPTSEPTRGDRRGGLRRSRRSQPSA